MTQQKIYKEVKSGFDKEIINLEVGQSIEGKFLEIIMGKFGYLIETEDILISANDVLHNKIKHLPTGTDIRVTRLDDVKSEKSGFTYKNYKVEYAE